MTYRQGLAPFFVVPFCGALLWCPFVVLLR